ncbi:MAG: hypothetical protein IH600_02375 [Bacteroidetes bacterium]|nr:hypothetical protein [Bacteroidota bacterium]
MAVLLGLGMLLAPFMGAVTAGAGRSAEQTPRSRAVAPASNLDRRIERSLSSDSVRFQENRGQFVDTHGQPCSEIQYTAKLPGASVYLRPDGISTVLVQNGKDDPVSELSVSTRSGTRYCRVDMTLLGCNAASRLSPREQADGVVNFYSTRYPEGLRGVREFHRVVYEEIYPHIDLEVFAAEGRLKYNFIVHPGGNPQQIRMLYDGADDITVAADGSLVITTPLGNIEENAPQSWTAETKRSVRAAFRMHDRCVSFEIGQYDSTQTLIIDPWATYYGGYDHDFGHSIAVDASGNVFATGAAASPTLIASPGAYRESYSGSRNDGFIVKFNSAGMRVWATYFESNIESMPSAGYSGWPVTSIVVHPDQGICVGSTCQGSTAGVDDGDIAVRKFTTDGLLSWERFIRGPSYERCSRITTDAQGNVIVVGWSMSTTGIATSGAFQAQNNGYVDGVVAKFTSTGTLLWSTYLGGLLTDLSWGVVADVQGNIYVAGATISPDGISTPGAFQTTLQPGPANHNWDAFLVKFNSNGVRLWGTYFGAANDEDWINLAIDDQANLYLVGWSRSPNGLATPGAYMTTNHLGSFLAKFTSDGRRIWSTFISDESPNMVRLQAIAVAQSGRIFLGGEVQGQFSQAGSPGTHQPEKKSYQDGFLTVFTPDGGFDWATYFGGEYNDAITGLCLDANEDLYFVGWTMSAHHIATKDAYQPHLLGTYDAFITVMRGGLICDSSGMLLHPVDTTVCEGQGLSFSAAAFGPMLSFQWQVDTGSGFVDVVANSVYYGEATPLLAIRAARWTDSGNRYRCVITDRCFRELRSDSVTLSVLPSPEVYITALGPTRLCKGGLVPLVATADPSLRYIWRRDGIDIPGADGPLFNATEAGSYNVVVVNALDCQDTSNAILVEINPGPGAILQPGDSVALCPGDLIRLNVITTSAIQFRWLCDGIDMNAPNRPYLDVRREGLYRVIATDVDGCADTSDVTLVRMLQGPGASLLASGSLAFCRGDSVVLRANTGNGLQYRWMRNGIILDSVRTSRLVVRASGSYRVLVTNDEGCTDTSTAVSISAGPDAGITLSGPTELCEGDTLWLVTATGRGITYHWTKDDVDLPGVTTGILPATSSGDYRVIVIDSLGCIDTSRIVTVTMLPGPSAHLLATGPTEFCPGDSVVLRADTGSGFLYQWLLDGRRILGAVTDRYVARTVGRYQVIIFDSLGCRDSSEVLFVNPWPPPLAAAGADTMVCHGESVRLGNRLSGSPPLRECTWSPTTGLDSANVAQPLASPQGTTLYILRATDEHGCTVTDSVRVVVHDSPAPVIIAGGPLTFCQGDSVELFTAPGFESYLWQPGGERGNRIRVGGSGSYSVEVENAAGCRGISPPMEVTVHSLPVVSIDGPLSVCRNARGIYSVPGEPGVSYRWSVVSGLILSRADSAAVQVRWDTNGLGVVSLTAQHLTTGCIATRADTISVSESLQPRITPNPALLCAGDSIELDAGSGYSTYSWSTGETEQKIIVRAGGSYAVHVSDEGGCEGTDTVVVTVLPPLPVSIELSGSRRFCQGDSVVLRTQLPYLHYQWLHDGIETGDTARSLTVRTSGTYVVRVRDANGCAAESPPEPLESSTIGEVRLTGPNTGCVSDTAEYVLSPIGLYTYHWTLTGGSIVSGIGTSAVRVIWTTPGSNRVHVEVLDTTSGCRGNAALQVAVGAGITPGIRALDDTVFCDGGNVVLEADPGYWQYYWTTGEQTRQILVTRTGSYRVRAWDSLCSGWSRPMYITVLPAPAPSILPPGPLWICAGDSLRLEASDGYVAYRWTRDGAALTGKDRFLTVRDSGNYRVEVMDAQGCEGSAPPVRVSIHPLTLAEISVDGVVLTASDGIAWQWWLDDSLLTGAVTRSVTVPRSGRYTVYVTDTNGCMAESEPVDVTLVGASCTLALPDLLVRPGDRFSIPILLAEEEGLRRAGADSVRFTLLFDRTVLLPESMPFVDSIRFRKVSVQATRVEAGQVLARVDVLALWGATNETPLTLSEVRWTGTAVDVTQRAGRVRLELCQEGGTRLYQAGGRTQFLGSRPNPFNASTIIEYEVGEAGVMELSVHDVLGRRVAVLAHGEMQPGVYQAIFTADALPSGSYVSILRSETITVFHWLVLVK